MKIRKRKKEIYAVTVIQHLPGIAYAHTAMAVRLAQLSRMLSAKHAEFYASIEDSLGEGLSNSPHVPSFIPDLFLRELVDGTKEASY